MPSPFNFILKILTSKFIWQVFHTHEIEGSGGAGAPAIYNKDGSGTPNYVDDPENEGLFRKVVI